MNSALHWLDDQLAALEISDAPGPTHPNPTVARLMLQVQAWHETLPAYQRNSGQQLHAIAAGAKVQIRRGGVGYRHLVEAIKALGWGSATENPTRLDHVKWLPPVTDLPGPAFERSGDTALLTVVEVAQVFGVDRVTVWRWLREGRLQAEVSTPHARIAPEEVERLKKVMERDAVARELKLKQRRIRTRKG